jgi:hypothetical protein
MSLRLGPALLIVALACGCRSAGGPPVSPRSAAVLAPPPAAAVPTVPAPAPSREPDGTLHSTLVTWRCAASGCTSAPWTGAVIPWPEGTAHQGNGRKGNAGRDVFSAGGRPLYPYMGPWANGCEVTAVSGVVDVVEWVHGAETWRTTRLKPGQSHTIALTPPEDSALLEAPDGVPAFSLTVTSCTPQPLPTAPVPAAP